MSFSMDNQDAVIRKRLEVDERPLKKLAKKLLQTARAAEPGMELCVPDLSADFAQYEHTLRRLSLLMKANMQEIRRHEFEVASIKDQYSKSQDKLEALKNEFEDERRAMDDRASYDTIVRDIRECAPRSRKAQATIISKLEEEVSELESEKKSYGQTWQMRKSAFDEIMARLLNLQTEISGEKADAELRDAAAEESEDDESPEQAAKTAQSMPLAASDSQVNKQVVDDPTTAVDDGQTRTQVEVTVDLMDTT